jgi:hypothetical protein
MFRRLMSCNQASKTGRVSSFFAEGSRFRLEFLAFGVMFPAATEYVFDTLHVCLELPLDLASPNDRFLQLVVGPAFAPCGRLQKIDIVF